MELKVIAVAVQCLSLDGEGGGHSLCPALLDELDVECLVWTVDFIADHWVLKVLCMHTDLMLTASLGLYAA